MPRPVSSSRMTMIKIKWDQFKANHDNREKGFEDLCYHLFCREHGKAGIHRYKNQVGIETDPINVDNKYRGFQSKFSEVGISYLKFTHSLEKAKEKYPNLNWVRCYVNNEVTQSRKPWKNNLNQQEKFEKIAEDFGITIDWFYPSHFEIILNKPSNLDLAQRYFGIGDEFGFIESGKDPEIWDLLSSKTYLEIPLIQGKTIITDPVVEILQSTNNKFLIVGQPGTGKSIFMHSLFRRFGGLDQDKKEERLNVLTKNGAIPMLINLRDCINDSLETLLQLRQQEYRVRSNNSKLIYLFDGLDELTEEGSDRVLSFIRRLESQQTTKKIVISCRAGSINRSAAARHLRDLEEIQLSDLDKNSILKFFRAKDIESKTKRLEEFYDKSVGLVAEIKDILEVCLLWETIEDLNESSAAADLMEYKIRRLLNELDHRKNINSLNLPDRKIDALMELNQDISFEFQKKHQFRFSRKELQEIVLNRFSKLDYKALNALIHYQSDMFFGGAPSRDESGDSFIYQHRRYQEFFFCQKLRIEFEKDPAILRELDVLTNREFLDGYFLPYIKNKYKQAQDIVGLLSVNLIDVYLGNNPNFRVDDHYYLG